MHNLIIKKIWNVIQFKRGAAMPHLKLEVLRKPCSTDNGYSSPR